MKWWEDFKRWLGFGVTDRSDAKVRWAGSQNYGKEPVVDSLLRATAERPKMAAGRSIGGRLSIDTPDALNSFGMAIQPPMNAEDFWRIYKLDQYTLQRLSPAKLLELLSDLSPDVARGLWDFLRLCNPGYECKVYRVRQAEGEEKAIDEGAQAVLDGFLAQLKELYGDVNVVFNRLFLAAYLRGAFLAELVLDEAGKMPVDLVTPDPITVRFEREIDPVRGQIFIPGQWQRGQFVRLDRPTIKYIPVDPFPGSPYGRPVAAPALFSAIFLLLLLHDLKRVVQQQGYPRMDIEIDLEVLKAALPGKAQTDPTEFKKWVNDTITEVQKAYQSLAPDDAFVHTSAAKVNKPVGTLNAQALSAVSDLIEFLERQLVRALKTMPLMMGTTDGVSEANANRQWEIQAAGTKSVQHPAESLLAVLFTVALNAQGVQGKVVMKFAELRAAEKLRDAQVDQLEIENARAKYDHGWISQDEAAELGAGKKKADAKEPRAAAQQNGGNVDNAQPDPGSNRTVNSTVTSELVV